MADRLRARARASLRVMRLLSSFTLSGTPTGGNAPRPVAAVRGQGGLGRSSVAGRVRVKAVGPAMESGAKGR
eukprot:2628319-Prymnesium_polylepis.2